MEIRFGQDSADITGGRLHLMDFSELNTIEHHAFNDSRYYLHDPHTIALPLRIMLIAGSLR